MFDFMVFEDYIPASARTLLRVVRVKMDSSQSAVPQGQPAVAPAAQGFVIEVKCFPGDKFVVSKEDMEPAAQESAEGESEGSGQKAGSLGEMLRIVMSIAKNNGATDGGQADFSAGYNEPAEPA